MRILHVVAGEKWTGVAAVVFDWTRALVEAGMEAQVAFVTASPLARRVLPLGWARPLLTRAHGAWAIASDTRTLRATLERERFEVLHAHRSHDHYLGALAVGGTGVRLVRTIHDIAHARLDPASRMLFRRTDAFAFANRSIAQRLGNAGPVHAPSVDTEKYAPGPKPPDLVERFGLAGDRCVCGTVAKIARGRGHAEAIEAAAPLGDRALLLHVGKGEHQPALEARAAGLRSSRRNVWAGYQDDTLPLFYRAMDVFLFTASGSQQGQRAILEAMASGLPVAALDVPGVCDLVTDGIEGFVVPRVEALTDALRRLCDDPALRSRMGEAARRRTQEFTGQRFAREAATFYESVLNRSPSGTPPNGRAGAPRI